MTAMTNVDRIQKQIEALTHDEFFELHKWVEEHFEDRWDRELEEDAAAGRLDALTEHALEDERQGRTRPL